MPDVPSVGWDDDAIQWNDAAGLWAQDCASTVLWNGDASWDDLEVDWNGCDFRGEDTTTPATGGGSKYEPHPDTRRYWESEAERFRVLRDDDELLCLI